MKKILLVFFFSLMYLNLYPASVFLVNDSPYPLTAVVNSADGRTLGTVTLNPGEQNGWSANFDRTDIKDVYNASSSTTPYSVIWKCSYQGYYSVCVNVSPGSTVAASGGTGAFTCVPHPKKEKCIPCCPPEEDNESAEDQ